MIIQTIQNIIWNIGGFLITMAFILFVLTYILSWIINRLSWWGKKESRDTMFYWIQNKERISKIVEAEKVKK